MGDQPSRSYDVDPGVQRFPGIIIGGSPPRLFRLTAAGERVVERLAEGEVVDESLLVASLLDAGAVHPRPGDDPAAFDPADVTTVVPTLGTPIAPPEGAIIVDDGSTPPIADATVRLDVNRGPAAARNAGLTRVETSLVAFVDADVEVDDGWFEPLLHHFDDPKVALVAPRVAGGGTTSAIGRYESEQGPLDLGDAPGPIRAGSRIGYVPAAALVCRVDALRSIGGFDENLRFGEDVDLVWRLHDAGWRSRYEPAARVAHAPRSSWRQWIEQRVSYGSSAAPLALRHPTALAPLRTNPWSLAAWALPFLGRTRRRRLRWIIAAGAVAAGSSLALVPRLPGVPPRDSIRFAAWGHAASGRHLAEAVRRAYWPILAAAAIPSMSARRALLAAALAARTPVRLADDVAYSVGVWQGMFERTTARPLMPSITVWPPRRSARNRAAPH